MTILHKDENKPLEDINSYIRLIARLLNLNNTRPYITFVTQQIEYQAVCMVMHYQAVCMVIRYLKHNLGCAIPFP